MPRNKKQKGGKVLGVGGFGCAIDPPKMCSSKMSSENKISKLIDLSGLSKLDMEDMEIEYKISQKFRKIDPNNKYFLGGIDKCNITSKDIDKKDLKECGISTKKTVPLLNIIMKKGQEHEKITKNLDEKDILKSIAHLLKGAKKAIYESNIVLLDVKALNILYVNSEKEFKDKKGKKVNKIHPVFIDFSPELVQQNKREFKQSMRGFDAFYPVWPLEVLLTIYMNSEKLPLPSTRDWKGNFDSKQEMKEVLQSNRDMDLEEFRDNIKSFLGIDIKKQRKEMEALVEMFKDDINNKYKQTAEKVLVYEIAMSYSHLAAKNKKLLKIIEPMLYPLYDARLNINQSLKRIEKVIGSIKDDDLLITYKKLNVFQKFHKFMTKPRGGGKMRGGGAMKPAGQTWDQYWAIERKIEANRRFKAMMAEQKKKAAKKKVVKKKVKKKVVKKKVSKKRVKKKVSKKSKLSTISE